MAEEHKYDISLRWIADRKGEVSSTALPLKIEVATPPDFPKGIPGIWSPEHFFVAAVNSCLMTTFLAVAENSKLEYVSFTCDSIGEVDKVEGKFQVTEIILKPTLTLPAGGNEERALRILDMSEKNCLISNSVKSKIVFEPKVVIE
jgi:peroxiredoxin-like protein